MFGKKKTRTIPEPPKAPIDAHGFLVRVMPKDFSGKEAMLKAATPKAASAPVPPPAVPAKSVVPLTTPPIPKKKSMRAYVLLFGLLFLVVLAGIAFVFLRPKPAPTVVTETPATVTPTPEPTPTPAPEPIVIKPGQDTDSDGLTDVEELLYHTDFRDPDTDKDTFLDGNEVFHGYDPRTKAPSHLLDTGAVVVAKQDGAPFSIFTPTTWAQSFVLENSVATMRAPSGVTVDISWMPWVDKKADDTLEDWVTANAASVAVSALTPTYTKEGYYGLTTKDARTTYIDGNHFVFVVTYNLHDAKQIDYLQTYLMMVNSFIVLP